MYYLVINDVSLYESVTAQPETIISNINIQ